MFTGIVELKGKLLSIKKNDDTSSGGNGLSIVIGESSEILKDAHIGDSIAVNGICLTVTEINDNKDNFKVNIAPETVRKTNIENMKEGMMVNLERAMNSSTRFGGHMVQGHVNTTVKVHKIEIDPPNSLILTFSIPKVSEIKDYHDDDVLLDILPKGFVCLDGVSLTVTNVDRELREFSVMLIPHTQKMVTLGTAKVGDDINLEVDINVKTIRRSLEANGILKRIEDKQDSLEKEINDIKQRLLKLENK